jgi:hypothetical protein
VSRYRGNRGEGVTVRRSTRVAWDEEQLRYTVTCENCDWTVDGKTYDEVKPAADAHETQCNTSAEAAAEEPAG